jgi:hypothetical protein
MQLLNVASTQQMSAIQVHDPRCGTPFSTIAAVDRLTSSGQAVAMQVYTRASIGRFDGYGSVNSALSAARNMSRGAQRDAVAIVRRMDGRFDVREAVWRILNDGASAAGDKLPYRHFAFEDGTLSQYTGWIGGRRIEVEAPRLWSRSATMSAVAIVDGARLLRVR